MIISEEFSGGKNILIAPELAMTIGCRVNNTGVSADENGEKIIKAGTPVGGTTKVLENRQTELSVTNSAESGANSQGVLLHDVNVTKGSANATLIIEGNVDSTKIDTINEAAKIALTKINFIAGGDR
jgi:hypothetical protein